MNTFKIYLNTYKPSLYMALMPIALFIFMIILQIYNPSHIKAAHNIPWLIYFFLFALLPQFYTRLFDKKPLYLLPASRTTKFFMPLGIAFLTIIASCLLTVPIEAVAHLFTMGNAPEEQIVIGGFLKNSFTHNTAIFISLVINCAFTFLHSLARNKIIIPSILIVILFALMNYAPHWSDYFLLAPTMMSTIAIIKCLAISAIFIAATYLIFKRWQPANDGLFRI